MRHASLALVALAACCTAVQAQAPAPVGAVAEVHGLVTMSFGSTVATVQADTPVFDGARFVASSSGGAELKFTDGCIVKLQPNQWVSIDSALTCDQRIAAVRFLTDTATAGASALMREAVPLLISTSLAGAITKLPEGKITPTPQ